MNPTRRATASSLIRSISLSVVALAVIGAPWPAAAAGADGFEGIVWRLERFVGKATTGAAKTGVERTVAADSRIDLVFEDGRVSGHSGCNSYAGSYVLEGTAVGIGPLASTRKACAPALMNQEDEYQRILTAVDAAALEGDRLKLTGPAGTLEFVSEGAPSLVGAWTMTGYNNDKGGVVSRKTGSTVTATFGPDGRLSGSAGCNSYSGTYQASGDALTVSQVVATQKMCIDADVMTQEQLYLRALQSSTTIELRGDTLRLRDAEGATQVTFKRATAATR
jgi:heat shock protein HslJ